MKKVKRNGIFSSVLKEKVPQSDHNLSYQNDVTMEAGLLYPIWIEPVVPGDIFFAGTSAFLRTEPLVAPLYANIDLEIRYFFVPNRFVWDYWREFLTNQVRGQKYADLSPFLGQHPIVKDPTTGYGPTGLQPGDLYDFMGVPGTYDGVTASIFPNALPFRMYNLIWNEFFRDENLQDPAVVPLTSGGDDPTFYTLRRVCWKKDRFTSALPWTQKGEDVNLDSLVKLLYKDREFSPTEAQDIDKDHYALWVRQALQSNLNFKWEIASGADSNQSPAGAGIQTIKGVSSEGTYINPGGGQGMTQMIDRDPFPHVWYDPNGSLGTQISIRRIRQASALQRILEKKALLGSRYSEYILGMYGVQIPDSENGRPTYLGGGVAPLATSPVEQTSETTNNSPLGTLAGKGVAAGAYRMNRPTLFNDFGYVMGVSYVRPRACYYQGMRRDLFHFDREEYYNPDYQLLGEEEIYLGEVCWPNDQDANKTFGYQQRYSNYKCHHDELHGNFTSDMISWVQPRVFDPANPPVLNGNFVKCEPYEDNNFAVSGRPHYLVNLFNDVMARRPMYRIPILRPGQL